MFKPVCLNAIVPLRLCAPSTSCLFYTNQRGPPKLSTPSVVSTVIQFSGVTCVMQPCLHCLTFEAVTGVAIVGIEFVAIHNTAGVSMAT